jgi:hypothetical protein
MSAFKSFLSHYASEAISIGDALATIVAGVALPASEAALVKGVIDRLAAAGQHITSGLSTVSEEVQIASTDIENAVKAVLPATVGPLVDDAVKLGLAALAHAPVSETVSALVADAVALATAELHKEVAALTARLDAPK